MIAEDAKHETTEPMAPYVSVAADVAIKAPAQSANEQTLVIARAIGRQIAREHLDETRADSDTAALDAP